MVSKFFHFSTQFSVKENLTKKYLVWQYEIRKNYSRKNTISKLIRIYTHTNNDTHLLLF